MGTTAQNTAGGIGIGLSLLGGGIGAWSALEAGRMNSDTAYGNADLADAMASDVLALGAVQEQRQRTQGRAALGSARASYAGQGVVVDSGSAGEVQRQIGAASETDALAIRENARRRAWGMRQRASQFRQEGDNALSSSKRQATASLLGTVGQVAMGSIPLMG